MRIAALSQVPGSLGVLEAVLTDVTAQQVDATVNLGDLLSGAVQPRATGRPSAGPGPAYGQR
jgi:hypothetical protein